MSSSNTNSIKQNSASQNNGSGTTTGVSTNNNSSAARGSVGLNQQQGGSNKHRRRGGGGNSNSGSNSKTSQNAMTSGSGHNSNSQEEGHEAKSGGGGNGASGGGRSNRGRNKKGSSDNSKGNANSGGKKGTPKNDEGSQASNTNNCTTDSNTNTGKKRRPKRRNNKGGGANNNPNKQGSSNNNKEKNTPKSSKKQSQASKQQAELDLKLKQQQELEQQKELQLQKIQAAKLQKQKERLQAKERTEQSIRDACLQMDQHIIHPTSVRSETRLSLSEEELGKSRALFQTQKKNLKSDLKKCTAFCRKIKSTQSWDLPSHTAGGGGAMNTVVTSILSDIEKLNLSRYTEEIAAAFLETKLKVADVPGVVAICVALYKRYNDFMDIFLPSLLAVFKSGGSGSEDAGKNKRVYLRILIEFAIVGILPDFKPVMKILSEAAGAPSSTFSSTTGGSATAVSSNKVSSGGTVNYNVTDAMLVVSFAKASGHEIIGVVPKSVKEHLSFLTRQIETAQSHAEDTVESHNEGEGEVTETSVTAAGDDDDDDTPLPISSDLISQAKQTIQRVQESIQFRSLPTEVGERFHKHLTGAFQSLSVSYLATHKRLVKLEKRCEQDRLLTGSLTEQREKGLLDAQKLLEAMKRSVEALSEALDEEVPIIAEEEEENADINEKTGLELYKGEDDRDANLGPFDDEETKEFYCTVPDLLTTIPSALLGLSPEDVERIKSENSQKYGAGFDSLPDDTEANAMEGDGSSLGEDQSKLEEELQGEDIIPETEKGDVENENKDAPHYKLNLLIEQELPECNRCDKIDQLAEKFCVNHGASKNSRKRLQRALFLLPRSRLDLLPYYSRLAAILDRVFADVAMPLVIELEQQFHGLARWKKQQSIDSRLRNARYLGELTKFRVAPPIVLLRCFKRCLDDFSGYNIDVACCLLESCGRYLHRTKHTFTRINNLMDTMVRIRKARNFDERSIALINSAIYMVTPPQTASRKVTKVLSPLEAYLKDLVLVRLQPEEKTISFVSKQILRFPWNRIETECSGLVVKYLLKACRRGRYKSIAAVAAVLAHLKKSKPELLARTTDSIIEELQYTMEKPSIHLQQRSLVYAKLLGELQSRALLAGSVIFDQLYRLLNYGHDIPASLHDASVNAQQNDSLSSPLPKTMLTGPKGISQTIEEDEEMEEEDEKLEVLVEEETQMPVAVSIHSKYDPRVPCSFDPPSAVFRIKLFCTLLDSCASSLVTSANKVKIEKLLVAFQRYLFTKSTLPTDIEFSLLDTFDLLESKLKSLDSDSKRSLSNIRYKTWAESHEVTVNAEEADELATEKALKRLLAQAGVANAAILGDEDGGNNDDLENNEIGYDDGDDSICDALSLNSNDHSSLDDVSESSKESLDDESSSAASDVISLAESDEEFDDDSEDEEDDLSFNDDEVDEAAAQEERIQMLEEEAFEQELRRLTMDALEKGKIAARTGSSAKVSDTMPTASHFVRKKTHSNNISTDVEKGSVLALGGENGISFKLLKRGHKGRVEAKELVVPVATNLAKMATKQDDEAAKERDLLKARVLQYEAESAELMYSGGDVFGDQARLPEVRNRPLLMEDIDKNFGRSTTASAYRGARPSNTTVRGGRGVGRLFDTRGRT